MLVAQRQLAASGVLDRHALIGFAAMLPDAASHRLAAILRVLFSGHPVELHHRPALINRPLNSRRTDTVPPANDPEFMVYLRKDEEHKIETYVRGQNGQLSDMGLRRKAKRAVRRQKTQRKRIAKPHGAKLRSANRWPPKGSQKIGWKR